MKLECQNINFSYLRNTPVLTDFSYEFKTGITILKGFSGSGKTTLLKIIAGYLKPQSGKIISPNGDRVGSRLYLRRGVSYMFQGINLLPLLSVERNLRLSAEMAMLPSKEWKPRAEALLKDLGLAELRRRRANRLSGGQAQRAALARTLMKDSPVIILDEPTSGLDAGNTAIIRERIIKEAKDKIWLISTHDNRLFDLGHEIIDFDNLVSR
ncbi:MAG: ATP-binding cassette domain-containing protein [Akkermansia sp.]